MMKMINNFNNEVEMGLRILILLEKIYPKSLDLELINYFDYFTLHAKDIGGNESLHPDISSRFGELYVKRNLIHLSLRFLISKGLVKVVYTSQGLEYLATEIASPFIDNLSEEYTTKLSSTIEWVSNKFQNLTDEEIKKFVKDNQLRWKNNILNRTKL